MDLHAQKSTSGRDLLAPLVELPRVGATVLEPASPGDVLGAATLGELQGLGSEVFGVPPCPVHVRPRRSWRGSLLAVAGVDIIALVVAVIGAVAADEAIHDQIRSIDAILACGIYAAAFVPFLWAYGLYRRARRRIVASMFPDLGRLFHAVLLSCLVLVVAAPRVHELLGLPVLGIGRTVVVGAACLVLVPLGRVAGRSLTCPEGGRRILLVGSGRIADIVVGRCLAVSDAQVIGYVDDSSRPECATPGLAKLGGIDDLREVVAAHEVDQVVVAFTPTSGDKLADSLRSLAGEVRISVVPRMFDLLTVDSHLDDLHGLPLLDVAPANLGMASRLAKRTLDLGVSIGLLVLAAPVMAAIAVLIKVTSAGPVMFRQERAGRRGEPFEIYKFRTMYVGAERKRAEMARHNEVDGPLFKLREDPRVTPIGRFLRRTSLDELPQLFNVVVGQMSLVGPRPFITAEAVLIDGWASKRMEVRPGVTGLWQISGRNDLPFEELRRLDYSYVASWSLLWDLRILWHTPAAVLRRRGAY